MNEKNYHDIDYNPVSGINYYKLIQVDIDGKECNYKTIAVLFNMKGQFKVIPNPNNGLVFNLYMKDINFDKNNNVWISIYNGQGQLMYSEATKINNISYTIDLPKKLASGYYQFQITQGDELLVNEKMVVN